MSDERAALAAEAFLYGLPPVADLSEVGRFVRRGIGGVPATPFNRFGPGNSPLSGQSLVARAPPRPVLAH